MSDDKLSCGVVLARATDAGYVTLMLRAWHHWDFPKGLMEEGEEPVQAALREHDPAGKLVVAQTGAPRSTSTGAELMALRAAK